MKKLTILIPSLVMLTLSAIQNSQGMDDFSDDEKQNPSVSSKLTSKNPSEEYFLEVGRHGEERLNILNDLINNTSQRFLQKIGLNPGMHIFELGCGTGQMSAWLAKNVLPEGKVIAIDNSEEQIKLAKGLSQKEGISNIDFHVTSAHDITSLGLNNKIDIVFSRFVLTHLNNHKLVLRKLKDLLKDNTGILVTQDLITSHIFSYPEHAVLKEAQSLYSKLYEHFGKDPDIGKKLPSLYHEINLRVVDYKYYHPLLKTENEKLQIARAMIETKKTLIDNKFSDPQTIDRIITGLSLLAKDPNLVISFLPNIIIAGKKIPTSKVNQEDQKINSLPLSSPSNNIFEVSWKWGKESNLGTLIQEIHQLCALSYEDPSTIINSALKHCNKLYFNRQQNGELSSVVMVGWKNINFNGQVLPTVYMGLGATHSYVKNTGSITFLFRRFLQDAETWEKENGQRLLMWYVTASPYVFHLMDHLFSDSEPRSDDSYTDEGKELTLAIRKEMNWPLTPETPHFVLKGLFEGTRY